MSTSSRSAPRRSRTATPPTCGSSTRRSPRCSSTSKDGDLIVGKSTVPVGTACPAGSQLVAERQPGATLAWNPEFLREGFAVQGHDQPRTGWSTACRRARPGSVPRALLDEVYASAVGAGTPVIVTDYATAELVKVSANAFLATKISFINAMAEIAEATGADVTQLADAIGHDARIGRRFLNAGVGFGGGCLPKDIRAFSARARELGQGGGAGLPRRGRQDQPPTPSARRRSGAPRRSAALAGARVGDARTGVQAPLGRHPRLPGARGRDAPGRGRSLGDRHRPAGRRHGAAPGAAAGRTRHRWRRR